MKAQTSIKRNEILSNLAVFKPVTKLVTVLDTIERFEDVYKADAWFFDHKNKNRYFFCCHNHLSDAGK